MKPISGPFFSVTLLITNSHNAKFGWNDRTAWKLPSVVWARKMQTPLECVTRSGEQRWINRIFRKDHLFCLIWFTAAFAEFVVIHNGIITNYKELREYLVSQKEAVSCDMCADKELPSCEMFTPSWKNKKFLFLERQALGEIWDEYRRLFCLHARTSASQARHPSALFQTAQAMPKLPQVSIIIGFTVGRKKKIYLVKKNPSC